MEKITTAVSYAIAGTFLWFCRLSLQDIAFLTGMLLGIGTFFVNWYYRRKTYQLFQANNASEKEAA